MKKKGKGLSKAELAEKEAISRSYREECRRLDQELEEENRSINYFEQDREKVNYIWMTQKRTIEELQAELLDRQKEMDDLTAKHQIENKLYQQRIKYIMLKNQDENVELQKDAVIALKQDEDGNRIKEKDYKYDVRSLSKMEKEQEILQNDFINALKKDSIKEIHQLKMDYELKECQIRGFYREKMKEMKNNATDQRNQTIEQITNKKAKEIKLLTEQHNNEFNKMRNYYSDLNNKNLNKLKSLSDELKKAIDLQNVWKNKRSNKLRQMQKIEDPWNKLIEENKMLKIMEEKCKVNFGILAKWKDKYNSLIKQLLDSEYKYEVTFQKVTFLDKERNNYLDKYKSNLHQVEQESGLRNFILEKKLEIIEDNLEIKDVQLTELTKLIHMDPSENARWTATLEEVELLKSKMINDWEDELRRIKETHANMIKTYEAKLAEFGIPVEEIGFEPLLPVNDVKAVNAGDVNANANNAGNIANNMTNNMMVGGLAVQNINGPNFN